MENEPYINHDIDKPQDSPSTTPSSQERMPPEWRRYFTIHPSVKRLLPVIATSAITSLIVVALAALVLWANRGRIQRFLIAGIEREAPLALVAPENTEPEPTPIEPKELSVTDVVAKVNPSVVSIEVSQTVSVRVINPFGGNFPGFTVEQPEPQTKVVGKGTGFFVTSDGYIVTNRHVVDFSNATYAVSTASGKKYTAVVIAKDPVFDLAVMKVQGSGFPAVALGNSDQLQLGQSVVAIGFALGQFQNSVSTGIISGLSRSIVAGGLAGGGTEQLDRVIQTDAAINPGNSGGPLINLNGEVIGVNVATASAGQSISFAIPANSVKQVVDSVKRTGTIVRPFVGIQYTQIDDSVRAQLNLSVDYGVYVQESIAGSPASLAGIRRGDIILSIDGVRLDGDPSFASIIRGKSVGQTVSMQIFTPSGTNTMLKVKLIQAPNS